MEQYAGLDVSLEYTSMCVVDGAGRVVREANPLLSQRSIFSIAFRIVERP